MLHDKSGSVYILAGLHKSVRYEARGFLTTASPLQLHLLHVDLTGRHPDGDRVNDGRVLEERQTKRQEGETGRFKRGDSQTEM